MTYRATFNIVKSITVPMKKGFFSKPIPVQLQEQHQIHVGGLTEDETIYCEEAFTMKLVGLFTNSHVESVKVEVEEA